MAPSIKGFLSSLLSENIRQCGSNPSASKFDSADSGVMTDHSPIGTEVSLQSYPADMPCTFRNRDNFDTCMINYLVLAGHRTRVCLAFVYFFNWQSIGWAITSGIAYHPLCDTQGSSSHHPVRFCFSGPGLLQRATPSSKLQSDAHTILSITTG